ncbi:MAG: Fur family transcriptional regulator [Lutibacter sp.]
MIRRQTKTKEAILNLLTNSSKALSQDVIEVKLDIKINRATIYRVLNRFCEDGTVHKIVAEDGKQYFAVCKKCNEVEWIDHHFHFRCIKCDSIECLSAPVNYSIPKGYIVEGVNCVLSGICRDCQSCA